MTPEFCFIHPKRLATFPTTIIGFHWFRTTACHPQTNGMIESLHSTLKTAITQRKQSWFDALPIILLGIRNMSNEQGFSTATAITETQLLLPKPTIDQKYTNLTKDDIKEIVKEMQKLDITILSEEQLHTIQKSFMPKVLKTAIHVWLRADKIRKSLKVAYLGPYKIIKNRSILSHTLAGDEQSVSVERLKPAIFTNAHDRNNHYPHHVTLLAWISLTLSRHPYLSSIAPGRSSSQRAVVDRFYLVV